MTSSVKPQPVTLTVPATTAATLTVKRSFSTSTRIRTTTTTRTIKKLSQPTIVVTSYRSTTFIPTGVPGLTRRTAVPLALNRRQAPASYPAWSVQLSNANSAAAVQDWVFGYTSTCISQCSKNGASPVVNYANPSGPSTYLVACICSDGDRRSKPAFSMNKAANAAVAAQAVQRVIVGQPAVTITPTTTLTIMTTPTPTVTTVTLGPVATLRSTLPPVRTRTVTSYLRTTISTSVVATTLTRFTTAPGTQTVTSTTWLPMQTVQSSNLVLNPGFEGGLDGSDADPFLDWTLVGTGEWEFDVAPPYDGSTAAAALSGGDGSSLSQQIDVVAGATYSFGAYVSNPAARYAFITLDDVTVSTSTYSTSYSLLQGTYTAPATGAVTFSIGYSTYIPWQYVAFDDTFVDQIGTL